MKVLFVEDSDFYLQFRQGFFGRLGCLILNARGVEAALESCQTEKPELAVVASRLPDGEGAALCRKIRDLYRKRAPRMILIAAPGERHAGPSAWEERLEQPVDTEALMARISAILAGVTENRTVERLRSAASAGVLTGAIRDDLVEAFGLLWRIRLEHHAARIERKEAPDDFIDPSALPPITSAALGGSFRAIAAAQEWLAQELGLTHHRR